MKLINKFTLWYLSIALTCTIVGSIITYYSIKHRIDKASLERLTTVNDKVAAQLRAGNTPDEFIHGRKIQVEKIAAMPKDSMPVSEMSSDNAETKQVETKLTVHSFYAINNSFYQITSYAYITPSQQILSGLEISIIWKWVLILFLIAISGRLVSKLILSPFNKTLKVIESFSLKQKNKVQFPETRTKEFKELNDFLKKMTDNATQDYASIKEFAENASHELQTPVAIMRGKLELLTESGLNDEQAILISDIQNALEKLSRINNSLTLLTKLENHEYESKEPVDFSKTIYESIGSYRELMEMKSLELRTNIQDHIFLQLHPLLADLLLNNLIGNAIRHNIADGQITVALTPTSLIISNTGKQPDAPVEEFFLRFKKGNQCSSSIGIGLSIVKQICEMNSFTVQYIYNDGWHSLQINFKGVAQIAVSPETQKRQASSLQPVA